MGISVNLNFSDTQNVGYLLKFGKQEHLVSFQRGNIRFSKTIKYHEHETQFAIGDKDEGLWGIVHQSLNSTFLFSHPLILNEKSIDVTTSVKELKVFPDIQQFYVLCMSRIVSGEIERGEIIDRKILEEQDWDNVLIIFDSKGFMRSIGEHTRNSNTVFGPVTYFDYRVNQRNLNLLSKSEKYSFEREIRFIIEQSKDFDSYRRIDDWTVEVQIDDFSKSSVIIPTKDMF